MILAKYVSMLQETSEKLSEAHVDVSPRVRVPPELEKVFSEIRVLLERMASGHPLQPSITYFERAVKHILDSPESLQPVQKYFSYLHQFILSSLARGTSYIQSSEFADELENQYRLGQSLFRTHSNEPWVHSLKMFGEEVRGFLDDLGSDSTTLTLVSAINTFLTEGPTEAFASLAQVAERKRNDFIYNDVLGYLIPRILQALHAVPMPRFELITTQTGGQELELALDALLVLASQGHLSLAPDEVLIRSWNEVRILVDQSLREEAEEDDDRTPLLRAPAPPAGTTSRLQIQISGMRLSIKDVGYYVQYASAPLLNLLRFSYGDSGFLSLFVGSEKPNTGLSLTIDLERHPRSDKLFEVHSISSSFPGLTFSLNNSHHWILNNVFLLPLARPVVRLVLTKVLDAQLRQLLEVSEGFLSGVKRDAEVSSDVPDWSAYLTTFWNHFSELFQKEDQDPQPSSEEPEVQVDSSTHATLKGIVHTSITKPLDQPATSEEPIASTTTIAVGAGPQILPPSAVPTVESLDKPSVVAQEAISDAQDGINRVVVEAAQTRESVDQAAEREQKKERDELRKEGWRSAAFDI